MKNGSVIDFLIVVSKQGSFIADYPTELDKHELIDGVYCEDNYIENVPKENGIYKCKAEYWFKQGYCDGYPADGESEWGFKIFNVVKVY